MFVLPLQVPILEDEVEVSFAKIEIKWATKSDFNMVTLIKNFIISESEKYEVDPELSLAIVSCEGGFEDPKICNEIYGCIAGQGHFQFIPSTWNNIIFASFTPIPNYCRTREGVFVSECNITAGVWLLSVDGDTHWREWSGSCYLPIYQK